jgi:hypothetical protein
MGQNPPHVQKSSGLDDRDPEAIARDLEYDFAEDSSLPDLIDAGAPGAGPIKRKIDLEEGARGLTITGVALFIGKIVFAVTRRYRSGTAHDPLPTAVEELLRAAYLADVGKFAWDAMKTKAQRMWTDDGAAPGVTGHGGGYILRRLEALQAARPDMIVDVVGHSAGSIAICEMLIQNLSRLTPSLPQHPGRRLKPTHYMGLDTTRKFWNGSHTGADCTQDKADPKAGNPMGLGFT